MVQYCDRCTCFRDEFTEFLSDGVLSRLSTVFSRDPGSELRYVQDAIRSNKAEFVDWLLEKGGILYVCGDARNMAKGVNDAVADVIAQVEGIVHNLSQSRRVYVLWCTC